MKCLVINIASATSRMNFMSSQLENRGLTFEKIDAFTPDTIGQAQKKYAWNTWERPLKETEKACFLSHVEAWKMVADGVEPALILEDDALLSKNIIDVLGALENLEEIDHVTLEVRNRKKIVSTRSEKLIGKYWLVPLHQDRSGAAAYVLWPSGAKKLLNQAKVRVALADAMLCTTYELNSYQVEPACVVQLDQTASYGIFSLIDASSQIASGAAVAEKSNIGFFIRRCKSQFMLGLRMVRYFSTGRRRYIRLDVADFL